MGETGGRVQSADFSVISKDYAVPVLKGRERRTSGVLCGGLVVLCQMPKRHPRARPAPPHLRPRRARHKTLSCPSSSPSTPNTTAPFPEIPRYAHALVFAHCPLLPANACNVTTSFAALCRRSYPSMDAFRRGVTLRTHASPGSANTPCRPTQHKLHHVALQQALHHRRRPQGQARPDPRTYAGMQATNRR